MTTDEPSDRESKPTNASIQADIDARMFEQSPIHIIERFLESFSTDGHMTFKVSQHILEALAGRFRLFFSPESEMGTLDEAFGGKVARHRQARHAAARQFEIAFLVTAEMQRLRAIPKAKRGNGTPYELATQAIATDLGMSVDNVCRLYKASKPKRIAIPR